MAAMATECGECGQPLVVDTGDYDAESAVQDALVERIFREAGRSHTEVRGTAPFVYTCGACHTRTNCLLDFWAEVDLDEDGAFEQVTEFHELTVAEQAEDTTSSAERFEVADYEDQLAQELQLQLRLEQQELEWRVATFSDCFGTYMTHPNTVVTPQQIVCELLRRASSSVALYIYSFTDNAIQDAVIAACNRNVSVRLVMDAQQAKRSSEPFLRRARAAGATVKVFSPSGRYSSMHLKVMIIDDCILSSGSYNFSRTARTNCEILTVTRLPVVDTADGAVNVAAALKTFHFSM